MEYDNSWKRKKSKMFEFNSSTVFGISLRETKIKIITEDSADIFLTKMLILILLH